jgi:GT2 family glycosyltransferase
VSSPALRACVIVPWGAPGREIVGCLASLAAQECSTPFETIVVDAAPELGRTLHLPAGARRIDTGRALLPGAARNAGAAASSAEVVAFLDADCEADPGWIEAATRAIDDATDLAGGPVGNVFPAHPIASIDNLLQFAEQGPGRATGPAAYFPACSLAARASAFRAVGGFPEDRAIGEDVALSLAFAARRPDSLRFVSDMRVRHAGRRTWRGLAAHQRAFGHARAVTGFFLAPAAQRLGRHAWAIPLVAAKRFVFLLGRSVRENPGAVVRILAFFPVLAFGLWEWARGFRAGCLERGSGR